MQQSGPHITQLAETGNFLIRMKSQWSHPHTYLAEIDKRISTVNYRLSKYNMRSMRTKYQIKQ